jgi:hypothetical protein
MAATKRAAKSTKSSKSNSNDVAKITTQTVDMQQAIRERAYQLYLQRGGHHGRDAEDWLHAEAEVLERFGAQAA